MRAKAIVVLIICASLINCASKQVRIQKAREKDPKYQYNVGLFHLNQGNVEEAVKYFIKSLALDTRYYLAWNALGISHSMRGRLEESVQAYRKCLEINPQFTEAHNNLGTVYDRMGRLDLAETEWKTALLDPVFQSRELPYTNLARLYIQQDRLDEAFDSVQKAIEIQPRLAMAYNLRGQVYEKKNNLGEAVASYEAAVKIVPEDVLFNYNLGVASFKLTDYARAKAVFTKIRARATDTEMRDAISRYLRLIGEQR
jgi:Tfp pilus assembly protein PilF